MMNEKRAKRKQKKKANRQQAPPQRNGVVEIDLAVTLKPIAAGDYQARHVELSLSPLQALGLGTLFAALHADVPAKTANGRFVQTQNDAVRWLLEQIGSQAPQSVVR